jgi:hypothetical protein
MFSVPVCLPVCLLVPATNLLIGPAAWHGEHDEDMMSVASMMSMIYE